MGSKFIALVLAGGMISGLATSCIHPVRAVAVDDTADFEEYLNTLANVATGGVLPSGALQVLSAQYALAYAYSKAGAGANALHGQGFTCSGFTTYQGNTYFGGGYINDTATAETLRITRSEGDGGQTQDVVITAERYLNDPSYTDYCTKTAGGNLGLNPGGTSSYGSYYITASPGSDSFITTWNGEPVRNLVIGFTDRRTNGTSNYSSGALCWSFFYSGGYNFNSAFQGLSGTSFPDDLSALHTALQENYPDVDQQYYLDWDYDPGGGCTGCNCNVTVNVEPTINVEVNVEPTINVEVNVENPLPSEWLETIPEETTENPLEELPTLEVENFTDILQEPDEIVGENSGFWWECLKRWIVDNDKVWKYLLGLFTIGVIGIVLRRLG